MNVVSKVSCYFERSVVTLKSRKEYLNTVTYNTSVLLRIKYWTIWYTERYSTSTYKGVTNFQENSTVFWHTPFTVNKYCIVRPKASWTGFICRTHQYATTAIDCQTPSGQIPGDQPEQEIDGYGRS